MGQIMRLLRSIVHDEGITAIVATHDPLLIGMADRVASLKDGVLSWPRASRRLPPGARRRPSRLVFQGAGPPARPVSREITRR